MKADAKKSSTLDKKYSEAVDSCRQIQDKFYDEEMPRILEVAFLSPSPSSLSVLNFFLLSQKGLSNHGRNKT